MTLAEPTGDELIERSRGALGLLVLEHDDLAQRRHALRPQPPGLAAVELGSEGAQDGRVVKAPGEQEEDRVESER